MIFKRLVKPNEIAAIVVEPIQGEGGYVVPPDGWLAYLRDLCTEHGILLVADEVQSGMGRTGRMWAVEHWGVEPDIVLAGKGIASGMPLGAMIARADLMSWAVGAHGSTYGGNPVACAAALATIDLIEGGLSDNAADGRRLPARRAARAGGAAAADPGGARPRADDRRRVRRRARPPTRSRSQCFQRGVLTLRAGDPTIRMSPPLVINREQAATGLRVFEDACAAVAGR